MKINVVFKAQILAHSSTLSKDGNNTYYKAQVFLPETREAGSINVSQSVFNKLVDGETYSLFAEYNTDYKSLAIKDIINE